MKRNTYLMSKVVVAAVLAAGAVGIANADMGRFDSGYKYFFNQSIDKAPSAWRQANPHGLTERELQAMSSEVPAWQLQKPVFASAAADPSFRQNHPNGLTERELQALSSDAPAWHEANRRVTSALPGSAQTAHAAAGEPADAGKSTLVQRIADLLHRLNKGTSQSNL